MCNNDVRLITNVGGFLGHLNALVYDNVHVCADFIRKQ